MNLNTASTLASLRFTATQLEMGTDIEYRKAELKNLRQMLTGAIEGLFEDDELEEVIDEIRQRIDDLKRNPLSCGKHDKQSCSK